jgi:hypothetical protein
MNTIAQASFIFGLSAMIATTASAATQSTDSMADPSACRGLVVKAKQIRFGPTSLKAARSRRSRAR